jgi:hypothetical protein
MLFLAPDRLLNVVPLDSAVAACAAPLETNGKAVNATSVMVARSLLTNEYFTDLS